MVATHKDFETMWVDQGKIRDLWLVISQEIRLVKLRSKKVCVLLGWVVLTLHFSIIMNQYFHLRIKILVLSLNLQMLLQERLKRVVWRWCTKRSAPAWNMRQRPIVITI